MHQIPNFKLFLSRLAFGFAQSIEARYHVENEDVDGAAPTGDAPTTSEWSTILLPTRVRLILEVLWLVWLRDGLVFLENVSQEHDVSEWYKMQNEYWCLIIYNSAHKGLMMTIFMTAITKAERRSSWNIGKTLKGCEGCYSITTWLYFVKFGCAKLDGSGYRSFQCTWAFIIVYYIVVHVLSSLLSLFL